MSQASSRTRARWAKVFRDIDIDGSGHLCSDEMRRALELSGFRLAPRAFQKFLTEVDTDGDQSVSMDEFCDMAEKLQKWQAEFNKGRHVRIPRQYLTPVQYVQYCQLFREHVGEGGAMDLDGLERLFGKHETQVSRDRLQGIMSEVDIDNSGLIEEVEFLVLMIKAMTLKKRKVGPGLCPMRELHEEGWTNLELRRVGYDCVAFVELGVEAEELLQHFTISEVRRAGVALCELLRVGWNGSEGRQAGYELEELVQANCNVRTIRNAGYDDFMTAVSLRRLGVDAKRMKVGGWPLSELKLAGFSATDLRLAGYSATALNALQQKLVGEPMGELKTLERHNTWAIRRELPEEPVRARPATSS